MSGETPTAPAARGRARRGAGTGRAEGVSARDAAWMERALRLAERGWGQVAPNPLVGAVVVRGDEVVGEGFHARFGAEHAERAALRAAGERARGATLYVTLEPCAHHGKTPPCTEAIVAAGVRRVLFAARDPSPVSGAGARALRAAGVEVAAGPGREAATRLNAPFFWALRQPTPFTALKLALSLDAKLSERPGVRTTITGREAHAEVHRLRAGFDAVLVGGRTATVDDPQLTVREAVRPRRPPVRIVLDPDLRLAAESHLVSSARQAPVWAVAAEGVRGGRRAALEGAGVRVLEAPADAAGEVDLPATWRLLRAQGVESVLVEGGGRLAASLLDDHLVQRLYLLFAPRFLGPAGVDGFPALAAGLADRWAVTDRRALGADTLLELESADSA